ncbi:MAG: endonuclease/exonuclease/phosphatase family protein [Bacteroidaceae bacterium]|nr:endonuclease/exonuclease/phosphatase family protein [Bacteroidaceae bacterium]
MSLARTYAITAILLLGTILFAQTNKQQACAIAFYNMENLFDTIHCEGKNDYEFLPRGVNRWDSKRYNSKIENMATVVADLCDTYNSAIIGVCEVENSNVLSHLVSNPKLKAYNLKYIHRESDDTRGIDCALLYNPLLFTPEQSTLVPYGDSGWQNKTRGYLVVRGKLADEDIHIIVNHWPSRHAKSPAREYAASRVKAIKDSIATHHPQSMIAVIGDLNDNPDNKSLKEILEARRELAECNKSSDLYNPWWNTLRKQKQGTVVFRDRWQLYDQIIISRNMCDKEGLKYRQCHIHKPPYMLYSKGDYKGFPMRTFANGEWRNGYSDHLPVVISLGR